MTYRSSSFGVMLAACIVLTVSLLDCGGSDPAGNGHDGRQPHPSPAPESELARSAVFATAGDAETTIDLSAQGPGPFSLVDSPSTFSLKGNLLTISHDDPIHERANILIGNDGSTTTVWNATQPIDGPSFPLSVDGHWLRDASGVPWNLNGSSPWGLVVQIDREDASLYLSDRHEKAVNGILMRILEHRFSDNDPPSTNIYGETPFDGTLKTGEEDFTSPNPKYWQHVDWIIREAYRYGITVFAVPAYVGYQLGNQGWSEAISHNGPDRMAEYGEFLAERYENYPNIVWVMCGDNGPKRSSEDITVEVNAFAEAIRSKDSVHLMTAHGGRHNSATDVYDHKWLDFESSYSADDDVHVEVRTDREQIPVTPTFLIEAYYGNEHGLTDHDLRVQMWQAVLGGGFGHFYGNAPTWYFNARIAEDEHNFPDQSGLDWKEELDSFGAQYLENVAAVQRIRDLAVLEPDYNHEVLRSGYDPGGGEDKDYAPVMHDEQVLVAYLPTRRPVQIDTTAFTPGSYRIVWYNPRSGSHQSAAEQVFPIPEAMELTPPQQGDWVLLIDNKERDLPLP